MEAWVINQVANKHGTWISKWCSIPEWEHINDEVETSQNQIAKSSEQQNVRQRPKKKNIARGYTVEPVYNGHPRAHKNRLF